jgi:GNAT superfamily N-acetyltransferase
MATATELQGAGIGAALLAFAEDYLRKNSGARLFWCNARVRAVPFYVKHGWVPASEIFQIPGVGPHQKLFKRLE